MPIKHCEWCREIIEQKIGEKSVFFVKRRFCNRKCMAQAREMEKKITKQTSRDLRKKRVE